MKPKPLNPTTSKRMSDRLEAIRLFRQTIGGEVLMMGWVGGTPTKVTRVMVRCMRIGQLRSFSAVGWETSLNTPHANLHAQARGLRET